MRLTDFDYCLPKELIAQFPLEIRDSARLLVVDRAKQEIMHRDFKDFVSYLHKGDLLVFNDTKVLPSRLLGRRSSGGKVEVLLLSRREGLRFKAMLKPGRLKSGETVVFNEGSLTGRILSKDEIVFDADSIESVYKEGVMPLPPYIKRQAQELDREYYQTVYAKNDGAIASPTAGLHFTERLISDIESRQVDTDYVTLHVGPGTFKSVESEDISLHKMESEYFNIPQGAAAAIGKARDISARIFAVGTTSLRALETYASGRREGYTDLFICPGYKFKSADCLLTNFHLPRTTLFMLVCAFAGDGLAKRAYQEAIDKQYRFYSYGDAMLII